MAIIQWADRTFDRTNARRRRWRGNHGGVARRRAQRSLSLSLSIHPTIITWRDFLFFFFFAFSILWFRSEWMKCKYIYGEDAIIKKLRQQHKKKNRFTGWWDWEWQKMQIGQASRRSCLNIQDHFNLMKKIFIGFEMARCCCCYCWGVPIDFNPIDGSFFSC